MKKFISILLCGLLAASVVTGCSKEEDSSKNGNSVTLGEYKGIEGEKASAEVTDEDVEAELKKVQDQNSRLVTVAA